MITEKKIEIKNRNDYEKFYKIIRDSKSYAIISIYFNIRIVEPIDVLILTQFHIFQKKNNCKVKVLTEYSKVQLYLESIGFFKFCEDNYEEPSFIEWIPNIKAIPIRRIGRVNMNEYINTTVKYLKGFCIGKDLSMFELCLAEMVNNVYDHSKSKIGAYVFCQYYSNTNQIKVAVTDMGIGIPTAVNQWFALKNKKMLSPKDCVKWSIREKSSTESTPQNRGMGLSIINKFVEKNKGFWRMRSNEVLLNGYYYGNRYSTNDIYNFVGTTIEITIDISNLIDSYEEENYEWD